MPRARRRKRASMYAASLWSIGPPRSVSADAGPPRVAAPDEGAPSRQREGAVRPTDRLALVRVLVVTNITPDPATPARGSFVRDQVSALRRAGVDVQIYSFPVGRTHYPRATVEIRRRRREGSFDLVHAHYGLAGWCAFLAGARPLVVTLHRPHFRHRIVGPLSRRLARRLDLVAAASRALFAHEAGRPGLPRRPGATAVLPCGVDLERFRPASRREARERLGLDPGGRYLLFPAAASRRGKPPHPAPHVAPPP